MNSDNSFAPTLPVPPTQVRANRLAVALLAVITGMLLALGVLGWWLLAGIDARYSRVATETASSLNELQEVGLHAFAVYGSIVELPQTQDSAGRAALLQTISAERGTNDRLFEKLQVALTDPELRACLSDVVAKRQLSRVEADAFMAETGNTAPAALTTDRSLKLLHSYLAYQQACDKLTDRIETASLRATQELNREINHLRWLFLGVGVLPIATALVFLLISLGLLQVIKIDGQEE